MGHPRLCSAHLLIGGAHGLQWARLAVSYLHLSLSGGNGTVHDGCPASGGLSAEQAGRGHRG